MQVCMCMCTEVSDSQTNYLPWEQDVNGFSGELKRHFWHFHILWVCWRGLGHQSSGHFANFQLPASVKRSQRKALSLRHCVEQITSAHSKLGYIFCSFTKNMYKIKWKKSKHKIRCDTFCYADSVHTCVFLTSLSVHVGRGYVLCLRIDMNCHPKTKIWFKQSLQWDTQIYTETHTSPARFWRPVGKCKLARPE